MTRLALVDSLADQVRGRFASDPLLTKKVACRISNLQAVGCPS